MPIDTDTAHSLPRKGWHMNTTIEQSVSKPVCVILFALMLGAIG